MTWALLTEVYDRMEAEMIKTSLTAEGIPAELFQESIGYSSIPVSFGPFGQVQIFVPKENLAAAKTWLDAYQSGKLAD